MEINQVYRAPSIPKLSRRNIKSTLISSAIKPEVELKKTKFSFIKPLVTITPDSLVPIGGGGETKNPLIKYVESNLGIEKVLEQSNKLLSQIREQLSLDFLSRINEEKKELEENKKRIAAQKVKDKEKKIESGGKGLLGKTLSAVVAPAKSILQKLLDFFSLVLTGILVNTAFKWLQKPENQKKLKDFFNFLKEYWQELLIVFGAVKLLGLVNKIRKIANAIKGLIDFFKSNKTKLPCNCPKSPAQQGGLPDDCLPLKDCIDSLVKNPRRNGPMLEALASLIIATSAFEPVRKLLNQAPIQVPTAPTSSTTPQPPQQQRTRQGAPASQQRTSPGRPVGRSTPIVSNQQRLVQKRPWWDAFGLFGGASAEMQRQTVEKQAEEASKSKPRNLNVLIQQAKDQYKNNGERQRVWLQTKEGWAVSYGRVLGPTGEQNPYATPEVRVYTPLQTLKMGQPDPLQYLFFATNTPVIVDSFRLKPTTGISKSDKPIIRSTKPKDNIPKPTVSPSTFSGKPSGTSKIITVPKGTLPRRKIQETRNNLEKGLDNVGASGKLTKEQVDKLSVVLNMGGVGKSKGGTIPGLSGGGTISRPNQLRVNNIYTLASGGTIPSLSGGDTILTLSSGGTVNNFSHLNNSRINNIHTLAGGGTVGGPGRLGVDSVPAMIASGAQTMMGRFGGNALLAPGEEVIRTSSAMLFRPLLKDINDNAGRLWQSFTNAVRKQNNNETIITDLIDRFGKIIQEFKDLLDKESNELIRRPKPNRGGGFFSPSSGGSVIKKVDRGIGGLVQDVGGMIGRNRGRQTGLPGGGFIGEQLGRREASDRYQDFTNSIRSLLDNSRSNISTPNISTPNINIQNPVNLTQNVINPQIEKTILGDQKVYVVPLKDSRISTIQKKPTINYIKLPPQTVNLGGNKTGSLKLPSSGEATKVPSISPVDGSNSYISSTPLMYGILV